MLCMKNEMYMKREWIISCFTIIPKDRETDKLLMPSFKDGKCSFTDEDGNVVQLTDYTFREPLFLLKKPVDVTKDEFEWFDKDQTTSYGNMVAGMCIFTWALGNKIPFVNQSDPLTGNIDDIVAGAIRDKKIDVENGYKRYIAALDYLTVFSDFVTPVGSEKMFLPNKEVLKLRDRLLKEYKDQLGDPAVAAFIEEQITKADAESLKDDPSMGFLNKKMINTVRKKMHYLQGITRTIEDDTKIEFITRSLGEGSRPEDLAVEINSSRQGSYGRSANTAIGGVYTKLIQRAFGNAAIGGDDCGTDIGLPLLMTASNKKFLAGRYDAKTGKLIEHSVGKKVIMRDPAGCKEPDGNVCKMCLGDRVGNSGMALGSLGVNFSGGILNLFMSSFHATTLTLERVNLKERFK